MKKTALVLVALLWSVGWADTIRVEGSSVSRKVSIKGKDVVKVEAVDTTLVIEGKGDILEIDGSDNRVTVQGALNGIVITGSSNTLKVIGPLRDLDVRGCDNKILLDGDCRIIHYGGSGNQTRWMQRAGLKQPKVERTGWDNHFQVTNP